MVCPLCGKEYATPETLRAHLHTGHAKLSSLEVSKIHGAAKAAFRVQG